MLKKQNITKISAAAMLVSAAMIWGGSFVVVKSSLNYVTPMWQLVYRLAVASVSGIVLFLTQLRYVCKQYIKQGIILGFIFVAALIFQNYGANVSTASKCAFLTVSYVAFTPIIGALFLKRRLTPKKVITVTICMIGVGLVTLDESLSFAAGDIFLLATGAAYALHILYIDRCRGKNGAIIIHIVQIWTALVIAVIMAAMLEPFCITQEKSFWVSIAYCGIFEVLIGFFLQFKGQQNTNPSLAGIILSSECIFAWLFGVIFQNDPCDIKICAGGLLIFASAVIESLNNK